MQNNNKIPSRKPIRIISKNLILCEGVDALHFLISFLESTEYRKWLEEEDGIQIIDFGGNSELGRTLSILKIADNFDKGKICFDS